MVRKRVVKKQQMGWSPRGAYLLLQVRTRVLDQDWENAFRRWYPAFRPEGQQAKTAACPSGNLLFSLSVTLGSLTSESDSDEILTLDRRAITR